MVVARREIEAGGEIAVGVVSLGLATDSVEAAVAGAVRLVLLREAPALLALFVVVSVLVRRLVLGPLQQLNAALEQAQATGDLTVRLDGGRADEIGALAQRFNDFIATLREMLRQISVTADSLAGASRSVSGAAGQLFSRAQTEACALEEAAASLEEMTGSVRQNADNARQAAQLAVDSRTAAEQGGLVVTAAVESMQGITQSAKTIAEIVTVIDEIAFQTNLLASTPPWRRPEPASMAGASRWWPARSAAWPSARRPPPTRSRS
jgi:methyl-accepting chemotaxis protein